MPMKPTEVHRERLREEAAKIRLPDDIHDTLTAFNQIEPTLKEIGRPSIDPMFHRLRRIAVLLSCHDQLTEEEARIAVGALHYFLCDDDMVSDKYAGTVGLVDDALIVFAACEELEDAFIRLHV